MGSFDRGANNVHKTVSFLMAAALLGFGIFAVSFKGPEWYANRKREAARGGPTIHLNKMRSDGPAIWLSSKSSVEYTPNAKIIRTTVTQHQRR